jgi:hypothetical protein
MPSKAVLGIHPPPFNTFALNPIDKGDNPTEEFPTKGVVELKEVNSWPMFHANLNSQKSEIPKRKKVELKAISR